MKLIVHVCFQVRQGHTYISGYCNKPAYIMLVNRLYYNTCMCTITYNYTGTADYMYTWFCHHLNVAKFTERKQYWQKHCATFHCHCAKEWQGAVWLKIQHYSDSHRQYKPVPGTEIIPWLSMRLYTLFIYSQPYSEVDILLVSICVLS